ncbi:hypothetical protein Noda2021_09810 [Candidatus Dependentiae bacterium Noda2021]|nr:hypothetical protein Noda2021_09810 [Candidatus Dependentiae bacterium Noda2021]
MKQVCLLFFTFSFIAYGMEENINYFEIAPFEIIEPIIDYALDTPIAYKSVSEVNKDFHRVVENKLRKIKSKRERIINWCKKTNLEVTDTNTLIRLIYEHEQNPLGEAIVKIINNIGESSFVIPFIVEALAVKHYEPLRELIKNKEWWQLQNMINSLLQKEILGIRNVREIRFRVDLYTPQARAASASLFQPFFIEAGDLPDKDSCLKAGSLITTLLNHGIRPNICVPIPHTDYYRPLFHFACARGTLELVKKFIEKKVPINITDSFNMNAFHYLAFDSCNLQPIQERKKIIDELLTHKLEINKTSECYDRPTQFTVLDIAQKMIELNRADSNQVELISYLKQCGAKTYQELKTEGLL